MKIVFFGTSENSVILLEGIAPHFEIVGIVTAPDAPVGRKQSLTPSLVAQFAASHLPNVPVLKPVRLKDPEFLAALQNFNADLFLVLSYGKILPPAVINMPPLKTVNVHPSLLPKYRGATPMPAALLNGDSTTGNTLILMDEEMDHGPILAQRELAIDPDETYPELERKLALDSVDLTLQTLLDYAAGKIGGQPQNHDQATFCGLITKQDGQVDWSRPARQIYNQYRAYFRWPGIWTTWHGENLKILECAMGDTAIDAPLGTVLGSGTVVCGQNTTLKLIKLQRAGKNPTDIQSFLNGNKEFAGSVLGL